MKTTATVSSKGQITLPVEFRRANGITGGGQVKISWTGAKLSIQKEDEPDLAELHAQIKAHMKKRNIKPIAIEDIDAAIDKARLEDWRAKEARSRP